MVRTPACTDNCCLGMYNIVLVVVLAELLEVMLISVGTPATLRSRSGLVHDVPWEPDYQRVVVVRLDSLVAHVAVEVVVVLDR